jgi:hypothetical protein
MGAGAGQPVSVVFGWTGKRRYVTLRGSETDRREKLVQLTPRAVDYLAAHRRAARAIERRLRTEVGHEAFDALDDLLEALGGTGDLRMRDYLRQIGTRDI